MAQQSTSIHDSGEPQIEVLQKRLAKRLVGFSADVPVHISSWDMASTRPERRDFPVPELLLYALHEIMGFPAEGPGEKVRWTVYCMFLGTPLAFELRKFGFTICHPKDAEVNWTRLKGQLHAVVKIVEDWLQPLARKQLEAGNVTIGNHFSEFDHRYQFSRRLADEAYGRSKPSNEPTDDGDPFAAFIASVNQGLAAEREGFFHSTAMVDAFFSRLEHRLILLAGFLDRALANMTLLEFIRLNWDEKLKAVFDISSDRELQRRYADLKRIKEKVRNPFSHGGVENDWGSLFFHLERIGALPTNLTRIRESVRFNFLPLGTEGHALMVAIFDAFDDRLQAVSGLAQRLIEAGVDPGFDAKNRASYRAAMKSEQELEAFVEAWSYAWTRHANMDY